MSDSGPPRRLDRFRALEDATGTPLDVSNAPVAPELAAGELPFRRCAKCSMDAHRSARRCEMCGADLWTPEQGEFQTNLAAERRRQAEELREAADAIAARQAAAAAEQQGVARFDQLGRRQPEELEEPEPRGPPPPGLGLLARIPEGVHMTILVGLVALGSIQQLSGLLTLRRLLILALLSLPAVVGLLITRSYGALRPAPPVRRGPR